MAEGFSRKPLKKEQQDSQEKTRAEVRLEEVLEKVKKGDGDDIQRAFDEFDINSFCPPLTHTELARKLIESSEKGKYLLIENLSDFEGLNADIARRLIEKGSGEYVAKHISRFEDAGHVDIAHRLIKERYGFSVAKHLSDFKGVDHTDIAHRIIEKGHGVFVVKYFSNFKGVDHTDMARRLIGTGKGMCVYSVVGHLSDFEGLDHVDIAHRLIEEGYGWIVAQHLSNFEGLDHTDIAHRLIEEGHGKSVAQYLSNFKGLDADIAHWLIKEGYGESVVKYFSNFQKDDGFHEFDPYERHPWRLTEEQAKAASVFSKLLAGDAVDEETLREVGIDRGRIEPLLERVNGKIEAAHQEFLEKVRTPLRLTDDQREEILNPPVRLRPLPDVIRSFVARYLVQMAQGFTSDTLIDGLDSLLEKGFQSYVQAYTVDIPLYDKLYDEYDNLRDAGRYPLEVYVGRDGIYAWIGRRVQDVARRRKMGREKRMQMKEKGEILEINPKYIVYRGISATT